MTKLVTYYCDCCGKKIDESRYRVIANSCGFKCKKQFTSKSFALCEECFFKTFKEFGKEDDEE